MAQMLEIWYVTLPSSPLPSLFKNIFKNLLLQNHMAQMLEIGCVILPSGLLIKFVQMKVPGSKMAPGQRVLGLNHINTLKYSKFFLLGSDA